jgi:Ca-activated chloride channel family protein
VTVTRGEQLVRDLAPADFEVYEDGSRQPVRVFDATQVPLDLVLLLDLSSSMRDDMPIVHQAAQQFMSVLRPQDRGAVVTFTERVRVVQDLTSDRGAIEAAVTSAVARGSSAVHDALYVTLKHFGGAALRTGEVRRQAIAVLSDGEDTASLIAFEDVLVQARRTGMNVYTIGLRSALERSAPDYFDSAAYRLQTLATETGARAFFPATARELESVYATIADELKAQYSLAYAPSDRAFDGRFRRIRVRLPQHPEFQARARTGYSADPVPLRR